MSRLSFFRVSTTRAPQALQAQLGQVPLGPWRQPASPDSEGADPLLSSLGALGRRPSRTLLPPRVLGDSVPSLARGPGTSTTAPRPHHPRGMARLTPRNPDPQARHPHHIPELQRAQKGRSVPWEVS